MLRRSDVLCYTSQNVGEFWNACTRPLDRNGYGLSPKETDRRANCGRLAQMGDAQQLAPVAPVAQAVAPVRDQAPPVDLPSLQQRCMGNRKIAA